MKSSIKAFLVIAAPVAGMIFAVVGLGLVCAVLLDVLIRCMSVNDLKHVLIGFALAATGLTFLVYVAPPVNLD